jgi:S1-C subfamily serine protease
VDLASLAPDARKAYNKVRQSVVLITQNGSQGSGWAIEPGWIITNAHVVGDASTVRIRLPSDSGEPRDMNGTVRGRDTRRDLAAVQVTHGLSPLPTRVLTSADAATTIIKLGYSTGLVPYPSVAQGLVSAVFDHSGSALGPGTARLSDGSATSGGISLIIVEAPADPGDSGGPIADLSGTVVGTIFGAIVSSGEKRVTGQQQAIGVRDINLVWGDLKQGIDTSSR